MKKKTVLTLFQYIIFFGLGAILIWWQYTKLSPLDKNEIFASFHAVKGKIWLLAPVLIIGFLSHLFRALRWKLLLAPLKLKPSTPNITFAVLIGYLVNLLVPRMGEVVRCSVLAKYEQEPVDKIVGTMVAERSFDFICLVFVTLLTFVLQIDVANDYVQQQLGKVHLGIGSILIFMGVVFVGALSLIYTFRKHKHSKIGKFISGIGHGILSIKYMRQRGLFLFYTFLIWFCYLSLVYLGFKAIEATAHLGWIPALSVMVFGSLGMILTPGGIGAYPPAVQIVLVQLYQVKGSYALAFGWVSWMAQTAITLLFGLLSLLLLPLYNVKKNGQATMDH